ncbi:Serine/threonine-protein kinase cbk1 [Penicillium subrubescens]|uniref:non-specific serine/threonine protein kinase n=1 Tax=Penicillium subrubescens TaxID=1316194 RepID=A0A1Q5TQA6_9EURO|nr:Serine/threonine-protein kinase cbk1 [Penicillium subrubescens]
MTSSCFLETKPLINNTSGNTQLEVPDNSSQDLANDQPPDRKIDGQIQEENTQQNRVEGDDVHDSIPPESQAPSNSRLVDRVSQKLSLTFGHPTVVHRTHFRPRPSAIFSDFPISRSNSYRQGDGANDDSSDPSTPPSGSDSPIGCSKPWTPVTSAEPSPSSLEKHKGEARESSAVSNSISRPSSTSSGKSTTTAPSILTVEAATVAKVYLELYFNSIFENIDPRVHRQYELEQHISAFHLGSEEQEATRRNWAQQENEYLRQFRNLKTRMRTPRINQAASIAGYEVITVLGRGSFGVVRLVREKNPEQLAKDTHGSQAHDPNISSAMRPHLEALRSAMDGARHSKRRIMAGEKKEVYAMKAIKKSHMVRNCQEGHIRAERDFLVASEKSRWVVPLISSFQDDNYLYLVMDYMVGGDFLGLLIRKITLREDWTQFYIAEMVLCIEEAHRLSWIHRDIKPDNFLISASGHLKISDFGLAFDGHWSHDQAYYNNHRYSLLEKLGIAITGDAEDQVQAAEAEKDPNLDHNAKGYRVPQTGLLAWRNRKERRRFAKSVVGTSQYMAPEVIRGEMYDGRCDWWSLGVILYEQHSQYLQFPRESSTDKSVSLEAIDLIRSLIQEREYRLSSPKYRANNMLAGRPASTHYLYSMDPQYKDVTSYWVYPDDAAEIKVHPFFRGIRWNDLHITVPPYIPRVKDWEDTHYFDDWKDIENLENLEDSDTEKESDENASTKPQAASADNVASPSPDPPLIKRPVPGGDAIFPATPIEAVTPSAPKQNPEKQKERKRPRDKILRDRKAGKTALEIRKKGAFLGYTYRRPKRPAMALRSERGRQPFVRGALADLYAL